MPLKNKKGRPSQYYGCPIIQNRKTLKLFVPFISTLEYTSFNELESLMIRKHVEFKNAYQSMDNWKLIGILYFDTYLSAKNHAESLLKSQSENSSNIQISRILNH